MKEQWLQQHWRELLRFNKNWLIKGSTKFLLILALQIYINRHITSLSITTVHATSLLLLPTNISLINLIYHTHVQLRLMLKSLFLFMTTIISSCHWKSLAPFCLPKKRPENAFLTLRVNYRKIEQKNKLCHSKQQ